VSARSVSLPGGAFFMGSDFSVEEGPVHEEWVEPFEIDVFAVTNAQFADFVTATRYLTVAERPIDIPGADPVEPGSLVFTPTGGPVPLTDWRRWWNWVPGANWRQPYGPTSSIEGSDDHPVVQVAFEDASAYAAWAGKRLPTEVEWEYAARGGLDRATYAWGEETNAGAPFANTWQGHFPYQNDGAHGWKGTSPVGSFPPNAYGLFDMTGNTWEWTTTPWSDRHADPATTCQCSPAAAAESARRVLKGGSHLCAPEYCLRYRPAARSPQTEDSAATHVGFRCASSI
jgi:sulfatase modifying factor 1